MSPLQRSDFEALLAVQEIDSELDRLRERVATLERQTGAELAEAEAKAARHVEAAEQVLDDARRRQIRGEGALSDLEERARQAEARVRQLSDPGQIEAAQRELDRARAHASSTEDELLEAMEEVENGEAELARARGDLEEARRRRQEAEGARAGEREQAEADIVTAEGRRGEARQAVPPELLVRYDERRSAGHRVAVARFDSGRCGSCHLTLPATEADRIRTAPDDAVVTCDDCGTILVRRPRPARTEPVED